ncbi:hypothetical protein QFZ58_006030 [Streptomyces sp. B1I3]|nr:hypothetical protein [Streptomyces sp. B1I3]
MCSAWFHANNQVGMMYEYEAGQGARHTGKSQLYSVGLPPVGSQVPVLYDPRRPRRSMLRSEADEHRGFHGGWVTVLSVLWCVSIVGAIYAVTRYA